MKILLIANTAWYLYNFRLSLAETLIQRGDEVVLVSPHDEYVEKLRSAGIKHISIKMKRSGLNPLVDMATMIRLIIIYRNEQPDLVHHFTIKCVVYGSLAAKWIGISKIVNSITGLGFVFTGKKLVQKILQSLVRQFYRWSLRGTQVIFQNSDDKKEFFQFGKLGAVGYHVILGSGVDLDRFRQQEKPSGTPLIVLAARMLRDKGVYEFVEAAELIRLRKLEARMALVGDPDPQNPASITASQLNAWEKSNMIEWWGWQENMDNVYAQAHIVCLPSYREGLPKSLIEAAACGLPIVTTNTNGCRDVVIDGKNGVLVPVGDSEKLADALQLLITNPKLREKMGNKGRRIAEELFDIKKVIKETLDVYGLWIS